MWIRRIRVAPHERAFVYVDERAERYLCPGVHWLARLRGRLRVEKADTSDVIARLRDEQLALVPAEDLRVVRIGEGERGVVSYRGRALRWLGQGEHQVWIVERSAERGPDGERVMAPAVEVDVLDASAAEAEPLPADRKRIVPDGDYTEVTVPQGAVAIRFVDGVLDGRLGPGRHAAWTVLRQVKLLVIELREKLLHVTGQEVMTRDHVSLRLSVSVTYRVADAERLVTVARDPDDVLYLAVQLAAREAVTARTLDDLLGARDALAGEIADEVCQRAAAVGLEVSRVALKDVVLPGDMKELLNQVIEAQKQAEASVILRREEAASTRTLAQTAKVLADNPVLLRLKELEAYRDLAEKVGQVHVVVGEGVVPRLSLGGS